GRVNQIHSHEMSKAPQLRHYAHLLTRSVARGQEISSDEFAGNGRGRLMRIDRLLGEDEHGGRNIGPEDAELKPPRRPGHIVEDHRCSIGFHPRGTGRTPYLEAARSAT